MVKIGIDVGVTGALALLDNDQLSDLIDMPIMLNGKKHQINAAALTKILKRWSEPNITAYLESLSARPGQGVTSMFNFGCSYGIVQGVVAALNIPMVLVPPQVWKKHAGLIGKDKDMARTIAQRLYPAAELGLKKHVGRADAILIAMFGR